MNHENSGGRDLCETVSKAMIMTPEEQLKILEEFKKLKFGEDLEGKCLKKSEPSSTKSKAVSPEQKKEITESKPQTQEKQKQTQQIFEIHHEKALRNLPFSIHPKDQEHPFVPILTKKAGIKKRRVQDYRKALLEAKEKQQNKLKEFEKSLEKGLEKSVEKSQEKGQVKKEKEKVMIRYLYQRENKKKVRAICVSLDSRRFSNPQKIQTKKKYLYDDDNQSDDLEIFYARKKLREMNQKVFENYLTPKGRYFPKTGLKNWTDMFKAWSLY